MLLLFWRYTLFKILNDTKECNMFVVCICVEFFFVLDEPEFQVKKSEFIHLLSEKRHTIMSDRQKNSRNKIISQRYTNKSIFCDYDFSCEGMSLIAHIQYIEIETIKHNRCGLQKIRWFYSFFGRTHSSTYKIIYFTLVSLLYLFSNFLLLGILPDWLLIK